MDGIIASEVVKALVQFFGALFIAWCAVRLALARYKAEKLWERKLDAYVNLLTALSRIDRVLGTWELQAMNIPPELSDVEVQETRRRYYDARRDLEEAWGLAQLILPPEMANLLQSLRDDISRARGNAVSWMEAIIAEWAVLEDARRKILLIAKADLEGTKSPLRRDLRLDQKAESQ